MAIAYLHLEVVCAKLTVWVEVVGRKQVDEAVRQKEREIRVEVRG
jgi:hypothetical protein